MVQINTGEGGLAQLARWFGTYPTESYFTSACAWLWAVCAGLPACYGGAREPQQKHMGSSLVHGLCAVGMMSRTALPVLPAFPASKRPCLMPRTCSG